MPSVPLYLPSASNRPSITATAAAISPTVTTTAAPCPLTTTTSSPHNPLPPLLHTPLGLAILEIQGTLNMPDLATSRPDRDPHGAAHFPIGTIEFPLLPKSLPSLLDNGVPTGCDKDVTDGSGSPTSLFLPSSPTLPPQSAVGGSGDVSGAEVGPWMKTVHLYVGGRQRLVGEVRRLEKPLAVVGRRRNPVRREGVGVEIGAVVDVDGQVEDEHGSAEDGKAESLKPSPEPARLVRGMSSGAGHGHDGVVELQILDVVRWKLFFSGRPEFV